MSKFKEPEYKYEAFHIYETLIILREKGSKTVIGYVNKHPDDGGWFYFIKDYVSDFYNNREDAISELLTHFYTAKLDRKFIKAGLFNNENYVKR